MVGIPVRRDKQTIAKLVPKPVAGGASFLLSMHKARMRKKLWRMTGDVVYNKNEFFSFSSKVDASIL